jgi:hypothetical protein
MKETKEPLSLLTQNNQVDLRIDLSGLDPLEACAKVIITLETERRKKERRVWFYFGFAQNEGAPTLFAPIGQTLKQAIINGSVVRAMPANDGGWIARLAKKAN